MLLEMAMLLIVRDFEDFSRNFAIFRWFYREFTAFSSETMRLSFQSYFQHNLFKILSKSPIIKLNASIYDRFASTFPFIETEDQLNAIEDIKSDFLRVTNLEIMNSNINIPNYIF